MDGIVGFFVLVMGRLAGDEIAGITYGMPSHESRFDLGLLF